MMLPPTDVVHALADRYAIIRELGVGGMATVWLARDIKHGRDVALKVLKPEVAQSLGAARFLREVQFAASLAHPHILPLFDSGEAGDTLWYSMPNVAGATLRDRLAAGPIAVADAVRWSVEVAEALAYAHRLGVVHRDVKPENIMLYEGHAAIADFGIGKALTEVEGTTFTQIGASVGTPAYMSPEQAAGESVDGRSDLYSLGCVLYELLTGEPPFTGPTVQAVIAKRFVQTPADVTALRDGVGRAVARALQKTLARQAIDRWQTGEELATALREPEPASSHGGREGSTGDPAAPLPEASLAVLPFENLGGERDKDYLGDGIADEIVNALSAVPGLRVAARTSAFSFKGQRADVRSVGERLNVRHVLEGSIRTSGGKMRLTAQLVDAVDGYHLWSERYDRDLADIFAVQDEIAAAIAIKLAGSLLTLSAAPGASPAHVEALELVARGRALLTRRGASILEAISCLERAISLVPEHALAHAVLGDALRVSAQYGAAPWQQLIPRAESLLQRSLALDPGSAEAMAVLALIRFQYHLDLEGAVAVFDEALRLRPRLAEARTLRAAYVHCQWHNDPVSAEQDILQAVADDPANAFVHSAGALALSIVGKYVLAIQLSARALELDPTSFVAHYMRVWVLVHTKQWDAVPSAVSRAMTLFGRHNLILQVLPEYFVAIGEPSKAEAILAELRARAVTTPVPHFAFSLALWGLGRFDEAIDEAIQSAHARDHVFHVFTAGRWADALRTHPRYEEFLATINFR